MGPLGCACQGQWATNAVQWAFSKTCNILEFHQLFMAKTVVFGISWVAISVPQSNANTELWQMCKNWCKNELIMKHLPFTSIVGFRIKHHT